MAYGGSPALRAPINRFICQEKLVSFQLKNPPTDFIFGLVQSCQYDRTTTIITPFKFLPTFPQKIYGAADTAEEVDMQLKFTFFFTVISRSFFTENPMVDP